MEGGTPTVGVEPTARDDRATRQPADEAVRRDLCRACHSTRLEFTGFAMDPMPLAAAFAPSRELALAAPRYPLTWIRCEFCGLVQVLEDIPDHILYSTYRYAASTVPALVRHHRKFARFLVDRTWGADATLLDIGCNDGVLLRELPASWTCWGVDPSDVAAEAAAVAPWELVNLPIGDAALPPGFDLVVSSNALAHFTDIAGAFSKIAAVLDRFGELWIEVHDLDATLESGRWDTIYHEHKVEWSARSLANVAGEYDLTPIAMWREPLHGGLLRAGFRHDPPYWPRVHRREQFGRLAMAYRDRYRFDAGSGGRLGAYGAAASGSTWLNQMPELGVEFVVDDSPRRQGLFIPGLGIPIVGPDELRADDRVILTAANHAADIIARNPQVTRWLWIS